MPFSTAWARWLSLLVCGENWRMWVHHLFDNSLRWESSLPCRALRKSSSCSGQENEKVSVPGLESGCVHVCVRVCVCVCVCACVCVCGGGLSDFKARIGCVKCFMLGVSRYCSYLLVAGRVPWGVWINSHSLSPDSTLGLTPTHAGEGKMSRLKNMVEDSGKFPA